MCHNSSSSGSSRVATVLFWDFVFFTVKDATRQLLGGQRRPTPSPLKARDTIQETLFYIGLHTETLGPLTQLVN